MEDGEGWKVWRLKVLKFQTFTVLKIRRDFIKCSSGLNKYLMLNELAIHL